MADFKRIAKKLGSNAIHSEQQAGKKIFFEAPSDAFLFKDYWFSELADRISFEPASEEDVESGGCNAVKQKVTSHNNQHRTEKAFGIVDRDSLLATNPDLFYQADDSVFYQHNFINNIYTLNRWEIESYGLGLDNIRQCVKDKTLSESPADSSFEQLQQTMVLQTCASTFATLKSKKPEMNPNETDCETIRKRLEQVFSVSQTDINEEQSRITAFCDLEQDFEQRWFDLAKILDGKKVIGQLNNFYKNQLNREAKKGFSITGRELLSRVQPPQEIIDFIHQKILYI